MTRGIVSTRAITGGLNGRRRSEPEYSVLFPTGSHTFTPAVSGLYRFVLWGGGGGADAGVSSGASGAFVLAERRLSRGRAVPVTVGGGGALAGGAGGPTTVTLPGGEVLTAGGGAGATGGTATANTGRGDIAINGVDGTLGGAANDGADAPGTTDYVGGSGGTANTSGPAGCPGGGGNGNGSGGVLGGPGLAVIVRVA